MASKAERSSSGLFGNFKRLFMRGLAALLPTLVTIAILIWAYELVNTYMGRFIAHGCIAFLARLSVPEDVDVSLLVSKGLEDAQRYGDPTDTLHQNGPYAGEYETRQHARMAFLYARAKTSQDFRVRSAPELRRLLTEVTAARMAAGGTGVALGILGFVVAILLVWVMGFFLASFLGRRTWPQMESFVTQLPIVKAIYPHVKQVTDFLLSERKMEISGVVAVEYPRRGTWSLGLLTGESLADISRTAGKATVSVFIPSSPTPFTGYVITVPRGDVTEMPISIDDALKFTVSGGVIVPPQQQAGRADAASAGGTSGALPSGPDRGTEFPCRPD